MSEPSDEQDDKVNYDPYSEEEFHSDNENPIEGYPSKEEPEEPEDSYNDRLLRIASVNKNRFHRGPNIIGLG